MRKTKATPAAVLEAEPHTYRQGGTERSIAALAEATHRLTERRVRDLLPGKIETSRLVLRAPMRGDVPDLVRLADNKAIAERLERLPSPYTRADAVGFIEIMAQRADERPYAITLKDRLIGIAGFSYHEGRPPELGYWLGEPYWGQGYMTEAARMLVDEAQRTGAYDTIVARVLADNIGSLTVLEKLRFKRTGKAKGTTGNTLGKPMLLFELKRPRWM
ncbi:MAG: GNAT family N-acetyltransferase [Devosia sp.]